MLKHTNSELVTQVKAKFET